jgi:ABC-2 type transport system permease protein
MIQVFVKEINSFLNSLVGYVVLAVFLTGIGLLMWVFPESSVLNYGFADMATLFSLGPYVFMFLIPAITMRMLAEEKKTGTMEFLLTRPLHDAEIILGKYFAGVALVFFALLPTLIYYFSIRYLGNPPGNIDTAGTAGSYIGLLLLGAVFTAVGVFASSVTENQIVAFILAVFLCFLLYTGLDSLAAAGIWGAYGHFVEQLGISYHYLSMSKGLIDSRNIIYFMSLIALLLTSTNLVLGSRRW